MAAMNLNPRRFVSYYETQAGAGLPGFQGAPVLYGRGLGSIFSRLFRFVTPFLKSGVNIIKPHIKSAAKNIASDVIGRAVAKFNRPDNQPEAQEGSSIHILSRKPRRRPPGQRVIKKLATKTKKKSVAASKPRGRRSRDIF